MIRLLKIELNKILYSKVFWIILGLYVLLMIPIAFQLEDFIASFNVSSSTGTEGEEVTQPSMGSMLVAGNSIYKYPAVWHYITYLASWFKLLLAIVLIINVTNEYSYKTLRQNIIDGMSKWEVIWAKELVILLLSLFSAIVVVLLSFILGSNPDGVSIFEGFSIVITYLISIVLYLNFAYFLCSWLKRSGFVIGILFLYTLIIENLISYFLPDSIDQYFPMNLIDTMVPNPVSRLLGQEVVYDFSPVYIGVSLLYIALFIGLNHWMLKKGHAGK